MSSNSSVPEAFDELLALAEVLAATDNNEALEDILKSIDEVETLIRSKIHQIKKEYADDLQKSSNIPNQVLNSLTKKEFGLFQILLQHPNTVVSYADLEQAAGYTDTIYNNRDRLQNIKRSLVQKIPKNCGRIVTKSKIGMIWKPNY